MDARNPHFEPDDYEAINEAYFSEILKSRTWSCLPAGWLAPQVDAAASLPQFSTQPNDLVQFAVDETSALGETKERITQLVALWEGNPNIGINNVTLVPSVSTGTYAILMALQLRGVRNIIFETPAYFGSVQQARHLGMNVVTVPTYKHDAFEVPQQSFRALARALSPCAVWITQPKFALSSDRDPEQVIELSRSLTTHDYLVIDEAAEQNVPALMANLEPRSHGAEIVRIRGLVKGIGLNGIRLAFIIHSREFRDTLQRVLDATGASLDRFSLSAAAQMAERPDSFFGLLTASNQQIKARCALAMKMARGSRILPAKADNGYMSTWFVSFDSVDDCNRKKLLMHCAEKRMPVVLRASALFAKDPGWEAVRINYFTSEENVRLSMENLLSFI